MMRDVLLANGAVEEQFARTLHDMEEELERAMEEEIQAVVVGDEEQVEVEEDHSGLIPAPVSKTEANIMGRTIEETLATLSIVAHRELKSGTQYVTKANTSIRVGTVHTIFTGMKATCQIHRDRARYINIPKDKHQSSVHMDLLCWLDEVARPGCSEQEHFTSSMRLRRDKYNMKVKG